MDLSNTLGQFEYTKQYTKIKTEYVMYVILIISAILWGLKGIVGVNPLSIIPLISILYVVIGLCAFYFINKPSFFSPYMGETYFPCNSLPDVYPPNATWSITIQKISPNTKVVFWAAEPTDSIWKDSRMAYSNYSNYGIATSDSKGNAILRLRKPASYYEYNGFYKKEKVAHVNYRICKKAVGFLSEVKTVNI